MLSLTFYGGVNEIGGNKVLLGEGESRLFFDFGTSFKQRCQYFEEYLKPRTGAGLLDLLVMGLLPPLGFVFRDDLGSADLWTHFKLSPFYRELDINGVLLSHAHLDHSGYVSFLRPEIPIYTTAMTAFIAKAMQDSGKTDFEKEVSYYIPREEEKGAAKQRCFKVFDAQNLSLEALRFWQDTPGSRQLQTKPVEVADRVGSLTLRHFPVDHSIFGATAFAVETSSGWVVYTGDLRLRGRKGYLTEEFIEAAAQLKPAILICEGTNVESDVTVSEEEVYAKAQEAVRKAKALVIADFGPRNIERLLTFRQVAEETNRRLVILAKDAYLLKAMQPLSPEIPNLASDRFIYIYEDIKLRLDRWEKGIRSEYQAKLVSPEEVSQHQDSYILCFSFWDINELPSIMPRQGSAYIYSSSEVFDEEGALDIKRLHNWLNHFGMTGIGLPQEQLEWKVPEAERGLHASGHASGAELLELIQRINPRVLIPIHTEHPDYFVHNLEGTGIEVKLPKYGEEMRFS